MQTYETSLDGSRLRVGIIVSRFNNVVTERLLEGALEGLRAHGVADERIQVAHVPGAFELPLTAGLMAASQQVDTIACLAVNDVFVLDAWAKGAGADGKVLMLGDGNATYTKALGLELDASGFGMGIRGQRFAMIVKNGVVDKLQLEPSAGQCTVSGGESILSNL